MFYVDLALDREVKEALQRGASDIHFDAREEGLTIRYRIDGLLEEVDHVEKPYDEQLINRIKVVSGLDIGEKRLPQDGRWVWQEEGKSFLLRVSTIPSTKGETIVCRMMKNEGAHKSLAELGMNDLCIQHIHRLLHRPYGLLLISGPTGSGKTATMYALLRLLNGSESNLISLENPVEADIPGAIQVQVNEKIGLTFAKGLRAILRQDPDTIMIGEIRDEETASLAVQAALTGHLVISTIHTNRAYGVAERLIDMGVPSYLVEATLIGALSQRLFRCAHKKEGEVFYKGRQGLFELIAIPKEGYKGKSLEDFMVLSFEEAVKEVIEKGVTTKDEIYRLGFGDAYD